MSTNGFVFWKFSASTGGLLSAGIGAGVNVAIAGAAGGAVGTAFSSPVLSVGNSAYFGDPMMTGKQYLMGIAGGTLLGGTVNGITALAKGRNFWTGNLTPKPTVPVTPTAPTTPNQQSNTTQPKSIDNTLRQEIQTAVPDNQPAIYREEYLQKISLGDGQHTWNRHTIEIVVDNGKIFPNMGIDGKSVLVQQLGDHYGVNGVFETIIKDGMITHQRFIPGGIITGLPNQIVPEVSGSVGPVKPWW